MSSYSAEDEMYMTKRGDLNSMAMWNRPNWPRQNGNRCPGSLGPLVDKEDYTFRTPVNCRINRYLAHQMDGEAGDRSDRFGLLSSVS